MKDDLAHTARLLAESQEKVAQLSQTSLQLEQAAADVQSRLESEKEALVCARGQVEQLSELNDRFENEIADLQSVQAYMKQEQTKQRERNEMLQEQIASAKEVATAQRTELAELGLKFAERGEEMTKQQMHISALAGEVGELKTLQKHVQAALNDVVSDLAQVHQCAADAVQEGKETEEQVEEALETLQHRLEDKQRESDTLLAEKDALRSAASSSQQQMAEARRQLEIEVEEVSARE